VCAAGTFSSLSDSLLASVKINRAGNGCSYNPLIKPCNHSKIILYTN